MNQLDGENKFHLSSQLKGRKELYNRKKKIIYLLVNYFFQLLFKTISILVLYIVAICLYFQEVVRGKMSINFYTLHANNPALY